MIVCSFIVSLFGRGPARDKTFHRFAEKDLCVFVDAEGKGYERKIRDPLVTPF